MSNSRPRVVVVGAGFGGLWATKTLRRSPVEVVLIDRNNFHSFFPLLYQVAAAELQPGDIAYPVRTILRKQDNTRFLLAEVQRIDAGAKQVITTEGAVPYDYLVLGPGSATRYFGVPGAAEHSFSLRTLDEAITLRNQVLRCFEASHIPDRERESLLTFLVVGGGPTGVEYAGALQELINGPLRKDHRLAVGESRIVLVEAGPRLLPAFPDRLSRYAEKRLQRMGVHVSTNSAVQSVGPTQVTLQDGESIPTQTVVWTAGVGGPPAVGSWDLPQDESGRVPVLPTLQVDGRPDIFVTGDLAAPLTAAPMVAQNAIQQGRLAASNIEHLVAGREPEEYRYRDYGSMAVIGRNAAVAHLWGISLTRYPAWIIWLGLHLLKLVGFRNRIAALVSWTGDYLFRDRVARLVIGERLREPGE